MHLLTFLLFSLITHSAWSQTHAIDKNILKETIKALTADKMQGRYPGTAGIEEAAAYLENSFRAAGLVNVRREAFDLTESGWGEVYLSSGKKKFYNPDDIILHGQDHVDTEVSKELVFAGSGSVEELKSIDTKDRVVLVFLPNLRAFSDVAGVLKKRGAFALIAANVENTTQFESIRKGFKDHVTGKRLSLENKDSIRNLPAWDTMRFVNTFIIKNELIPSLTGMSVAVLKKSMNSEPLSNVAISNISIKAAFTRSTIRTANIVGELPGIYDSTIVISAHYDHLGTNDNGIYRGADDNASGTAGMIAIAKEYSKKILRYPMTFVAFTGEEEGLLGSVYHTNTKSFQSQNVLINVNLDMIGGTDAAHRERDSYLYCVSSTDVPPMNAELEKAAQMNDIGLDHSLSGAIGLYQRSDQYSFYRRGIPSIQFFSGLHARYHTPMDTQDQLNYALLERRVKFASTFVDLLQSRESKFHTAIFAHNDYVKPEPYYNALNAGAEYIEADIYLKDGELLVAHERSELDVTRKLSNLYLDPILKTMTDGAITFKYPLKLMIDLKTSGNTLKALVDLLSKYPELTSSKQLMITVSGAYPPPAEWTQYPAFIYFDGRPGIQYTAEQLKRIPLISIGYGSFSKWNGEGNLRDTDKQKLKSVVDASHALGKPFRFWAIPDNENGWKAMLELGVDIINTDKVNEFKSFLSTRN